MAKNLFLAVLLGHLLLASDAFRLQVLHHNDLHTKFEETNAHYGPCPKETKSEGKCYGGIARAMTVIKAAQVEARLSKTPSVLVNAGDFFTGTPYYRMKKWKLVVPMVNALKYDVITIGNHEFVSGIDNLVNFINHVEVPVVCCNLDLKTEPRLAASKIKSSIVLEIEGTKVGFTGCVTPDTMEYSQTENLKILPEIPSIQAEVRKLIDEQNVNIIILLSHSGFEIDTTIAHEVPELSLIVGGHSHIIFYNPSNEPPDWEDIEGPYPHIVKLTSGRKIPIVQSGSHGKYFGKLWITFDTEGKYVSASGNSILLNSSIPEDEAISELVEREIAPLREEAKLPIAYTRVSLLPADFGQHQFESTMYNLITDALVEYSVMRAQKEGLEKWTHAPIALMNTGCCFRVFGSEGSISLENLYDAFRNGNFIFEVTYRGSVLKEALEHSLISKKDRYHFPNFLHFSSLRAVYDLSKPEGKRIESLEALCADCLVPRYEKFEVDRMYTVILPRYLWEGYQGFTMLEKGATNVVNLGVEMEARDIVELYLGRVEVVYPFLDGRVKIKNYDLHVP